MISQDHTQIDFIDHKSFQNYLYTNINDSKITIFHMNIRSLNANFLEFEHFLSLLNSGTGNGIKIDIIALTECWLLNPELYINALPEYRMVYSGKSNKSGGVVVYYSKDRVQITETSVDFISGCDSIMLKFNCESAKNNALLTVYRSPSENAFFFIDNISEYIAKHKDQNRFILVGDFNICKKKQYSDKSSELFYDNLLELELYPLIGTDTRCSREMGVPGSIIDQVFINLNSLLTDTHIQSGNVDLNITDHKLQYLSIENKMINLVENLIKSN